MFILHYSDYGTALNAYHILDSLGRRCPRVFENLTDTIGTEMEINIDISVKPSSAAR